MSGMPSFPLDPLRESARLQAVHFEHLDLEELSADLGSPEEWLATAILHLKTQVCEGDLRMTGAIPVSVAAVCLVLLRLEELDCGSEPWRGNPS